MGLLISSVRGFSTHFRVRLRAGMEKLTTCGSGCLDFCRQHLGTGAPPTMLTVPPEHPWRWRESNPRPLASQLAFSERSRSLDLESGAASGELAPLQPAEMSLGGPPARPPE